VGSKTMIIFVFINPEQVDHFWLCSYRKKRIPAQRTIQARDHNYLIQASKEKTTKSITAHHKITHLKSV
jgi:hypothetical protein